MISIEKLEKVKQGDKLEINGKKYVVWGFDNSVIGLISKEPSKLLKGPNQMILIEDKKSEHLLPILYVLIYNKSKNEIKFFKEVYSDKSEFPKWFKQKRKGRFVKREEIKIK